MATRLRLATRPDYSLQANTLHLANKKCKNNQDSSQCDYVEAWHDTNIMMTCTRSYNRAWARLHVGAHLAPEAKGVFFRLRDNTLSNFMTGLRDVIVCWFRTNSGIKYQEMYAARRAAQGRATTTYIAAGLLPPDQPEIMINTTRFQSHPPIMPGRQLSPLTLQPTLSRRQSVSTATCHSSMPLSNAQCP